MKAHAPDVLLALPMFLQDGLDKYNGIMRFLCERRIKWNIRFDRLAPNWDQPSNGEIPGFDGVIADGLAPDSNKREYLKCRMPLATIDWFDCCRCPRRRKIASINSDSAEIGRTAAKTLLKFGEFASYAFLPQPDSPCWSTERGRAFLRYLRGRHMNPATIDTSRSIGPQLRDLPKPAAVFAAHDTIAAIAIRDARNAGISIPNDMSVLGVDNERLTCLHTDPPLATIQPDFERAGYLAASALDRMMRGEHAGRTHLYHVKATVMRSSLGHAGTGGKLVQRAMELIRDHALEYRGVGTYAAQLKVSRRLLDRRFRQITGRSILDVVQETRLENVCSLLRSTQLPISEICKTVAFGSGTYLLRLFRDKMGMTMRAYRKSRQCGG